jgi:hypothetical protein
MIDNLIHKLQDFTTRLDLGTKSTNNILKAIQHGDWDFVEYETNNRARILNIISTEQIYIEKIINNLIDEEVTSENIKLIKSWAFDTQSWIDKTALLDEKNIEALNNSKDEVTKDLAGLFKSKQAFRGYNLNDVTR